MTNKLREAAKQALDALDHWETHEYYEQEMSIRREAIAALRAALEAPGITSVGDAYLCDACDTPFDGSFRCPNRQCGHISATKRPVYVADGSAAASAADEALLRQALAVLTGPTSYQYAQWLTLVDKLTKRLENVE